MKKKFLAFGLTAAMVLGSVVSTFAADESKEYETTVIADYDFTNSNVPEGVTLEGASAVATAAGIKLANGYIVLPENLFANLPSDADKLVVEIKFSKQNSDWPESQCSERLFNFTDDNNAEDGVQSGTNGIGLTYNGNLGTTTNPYVNGKAYMDGALTGSNAIALDTMVTVKAELDFATNTASLYLNGELVKSGVSEDTIGVSDLKKYTYNSIGRSFDMWSMWGFMTVSNFKVSALTEVTAEEDPTDPAGEEPTTSNSTSGPTGAETGNKPGTGNENPTNPGTGNENPTNPDAGNENPSKPGLGGPGDETPSPNGGKEEVVKATVVSAKAAQEIAEAAVVTSADGKVLDVELTATPVEDTTAVAGLIAKNAKLMAAKVKAFAVLDLELKVGGKNVTLLDNKINVTIPMDKIFEDITAGAVVAVYRVDNNDLSFLGTREVAENKTITFATDHFSQYVFAVVGNAEALKDVEIADAKVLYPDEVPVKVADIPVKADASVEDPNQTGDTTPIMPLVVLAVIALGGVLAVVASKKRA